jgi:hypothetical protein
VISAYRAQASITHLDKGGRHKNLSTLGKPMRFYWFSVVTTKKAAGYQLPTNDQAKRTAIKESV